MACHMRDHASSLLFSREEALSLFLFFSLALEWWRQCDLHGDWATQGLGWWQCSCKYSRLEISPSLHHFLSLSLPLSLPPPPSPPILPLSLSLSIFLSLSDSLPPPPLSLSLSLSLSISRQFSLSLSLSLGFPVIDTTTSLFIFPSSHGS